MKVTHRRAHIKLKFEPFPPEFTPIHRQHGRCGMYSWYSQTHWGAWRSTCPGQPPAWLAERVRPLVQCLIPQTTGDALPDQRLLMAIRKARHGRKERGHLGAD